MAVRKCAVCRQPKIHRMEIQERIAKGETLESIAQWEGKLTVQELAYHRRQGHGNNLPALTSDRFHPAWPFITDLETLQQELLEILSIFMTDTDDSGQVRKSSLRDAVTTMREMRMVTEAKAKLAGAYDTPLQADSPAFQRLVTLMTQFVVKRPELKDDILQLLDEAKYGDKVQ